MVLTNKERAKIVVALKIEQLANGYKEEDYNEHLGYLIDKFLAPILGNEVNSGHIPNPKRMITIKRRIIDIWWRARKECNDERMIDIYTSLMLKSQKKIDKTLKIVDLKLGNMQFSSYLY